MDGTREAEKHVKKQLLTNGRARTTLESSDAVRKEHIIASEASSEPPPSSHLCLPVTQCDSPEENPTEEPVGIWLPNSSFICSGFVCRNDRDSCEMQLRGNLSINTPGKQANEVDCVFVCVCSQLPSSQQSITLSNCPYSPHIDVGQIFWLLFPSWLSRPSPRRLLHLVWTEMQILKQALGRIVDFRSFSTGGFNAQIPNTLICTFCMLQNFISGREKETALFF